MANEVVTAKEDDKVYDDVLAILAEFVNKVFVAKNAVNAVLATDTLLAVDA